MTPTPADCWVLAKLLAAQSLNGELALMSDPLRPLGERLAKTPAKRRNDALDWSVFLRPDRDSVIKQIADANPLGPPPPPDPTGGWGPLRLSTPLTVEPFPIGDFPPPVARLISEGTDAIGCPPDFLGLPVLAVAGGVIGRSVSLMLKAGYFVGPTVYAACVGPPSDGKTPALKIVAAAVRAIDEILAAEHAAEKERWRANQIGPDGKPLKTKPPPPPKPRRIEIDDATMEVISVILADNERGLIMIRDELTAFLLGMNQFKHGKGNDRSNALKIWSGDKIIKDRVGHENHEPIRCPHPMLSIVGGVVPDMLRELCDPKGRVDGFLDRFLVVYPEALPVADWSDTGIDDAVVRDWSEVVARLWMRQLALKDGRSVPHVAYFTPEGKALWEARYDAHIDAMNASDFDQSMRGTYGKFREYAGRLALILTCLRHAADPLADPLAVPDVGPRPVEDAWRLIRYFESHAKRVHHAIAEGPDGIGGGRIITAIVDWLRSGHRLTFTEHELRQARRWMQDDDVANALAYLENANAISPTARPQQPGSKGGRPGSASYEVHPLLLIAQNP